MRNIYKPGQWNAICDRCGFKFKSSELKKDWQGLMVCEHDYELRNPQDFLRVRPEKIAPDWARPESVDVFFTPLGFRDTVRADSGEGSDGDSQDYIDPTYFAQDYIADRFFILVSYVRAFADTFTSVDAITANIQPRLTDTFTTTDSLVTSFVSIRAFTDSVTVPDTGTGFLENYIQSGYFAQQYVGTSFSF